jgi:hypothetical protein
MKQINSRLEKPDESIFLNENENSFYLLGAYMADGNVDKRINRFGFSISSKDKDWLEILKNKINKNRIVMTTRLYENKNYLQFNSKNIKNWFISWGCIPNKSLSLRIEKEIPSEYVKDFLRGVVDGDGCVCLFNKNDKHKNKTYKYKVASCYISSASKTFVDQLMNIIPKEYNPRIYTISPENKKDCFINGKKINNNNYYYRVRFFGKNALNFLNYIYYTGHELSMPRKLNIVNSINEHYI